MLVFPVRSMLLLMAMHQVHRLLYHGRIGLSRAWREKMPRLWLQVRIFVFWAVSFLIFYIGKQKIAAKSTKKALCLTKLHLRGIITHDYGCFAHDPALTVFWRSGINRHDRLPPTRATRGEVQNLIAPKGP